MQNEKQSLQLSPCTMKPAPPWVQDTDILSTFKTFLFDKLCSYDWIRWHRCHYYILWMVVFFIVALWLPLQKSDSACSGLLLKGSSSSTLPPSGCSQGVFSNSVGSLPYSMMNSEMAFSLNWCYTNKVNWQQVSNMTEGWLALLLEIAWGVESLAKGKK